MNNVPKIMIIGITGKKGVGKTTSAEFLSRTYNYERLAFAKPLKDISRILFGLNDTQLYGDQKEVEDENNFGMTPRTILQLLGTDLFRNHFSTVFPDHGSPWIHAVQKQVEQSEQKLFVVEDCRFPDEVEFIRSKNGVIINVYDNCAVDHGDKHISETHELYYDHQVTNDKDKDDLYAQLRYIIEEEIK